MTAGVEETEPFFAAPPGMPVGGAAYTQRGDRKPECSGFRLPECTLSRFPERLARVQSEQQFKCLMYEVSIACKHARCSEHDWLNAVVFHELVTPDGFPERLARVQSEQQFMSLMYEVSIACKLDMCSEQEWFDGVVHKAELVQTVVGLLPEVRTGVIGSLAKINPDFARVLQDDQDAVRALAEADDFGSIESLCTQFMSMCSLHTVLEVASQNGWPDEKVRSWFKLFIPQFTIEDDIPHICSRYWKKLVGWLIADGPNGAWK